jgi:phospholipase C
MSIDPIEHVVVLMFENHSFDEILGCFKAVYPAIEGVDTANLRMNRDSAGQPYTQQSTTESSVNPDPKHELNNVLLQLSDHNANFVRDYSHEYPTTSQQQRQRIMSYYQMDALPAIHRLAREFTICDHWFSSVPGPTWTNRFFLLSGTSIGRVQMPSGIFDPSMHNYNQDTIFDRLNQRNISWRVYFGDIPHSLLFTHQHTNLSDMRRFRPMKEFYDHAAMVSTSFPRFSFIEPSYFRGELNDDHPPHDGLRAQKLLADVYNALRANKDLWNTTLFVVLYDEHGGLYDHLEPPAAICPDHHTEEYTFNRLGVRVPALLISPWVNATVLDTQFDHTSLIKYCSEKWNLAPLTARSAQANSFRAGIRDAGSPRVDTPERITIPGHLRVTSSLDSEAESGKLNENQEALLAFAHYLEKYIPDEPAAKVERSSLMMEGSHSRVEVAKRQVRLFLSQADPANSSSRQLRP